MPDFELEDKQDGIVFGIDEVGRGPLAGPVVAACVHIPQAARSLSFIKDIKDSKKISKPKLGKLYELITDHCDWAVAEISVDEIDDINILQASLKAMSLSFQNISKPNKYSKAYHCLVDGNKMPQLPCSAATVIKGDGKSYSIAAASIVAKVTRDRIMRELHEEFPHYSWNTNAGYGSKAHLSGIDAHGITKYHRKSFAPVRNFIEYGTTRNPSESAV